MQDSTKDGASEKKATAKIPSTQNDRNKEEKDTKTSATDKNRETKDDVKASANEDKTKEKNDKASSSKDKTSTDVKMSKKDGDEEKKGDMKSSTNDDKNKDTKNATTSRNEKKITTKLNIDNIKDKKAVKTIQQGTELVRQTGDFISRIGALLVMIVTTINTATVMVTSFIDQSYWIGGVHLFLLIFIHIPVISVMAWMTCSAYVQAAYRKIRPRRTEPLAQVTEVDETKGENSGDVTKTDNDKTTKKNAANNLRLRGGNISKGIDSLSNM